MTLSETYLDYRNLPDFFYSDVQALREPDYQIWYSNSELAGDLNLPKSWIGSEAGLKVLSGQETLSGDKPLAMAYAAHQFGHWAGLLGDGRASLVGDIADISGIRKELHLKGSGQTPYSRRGDGKATLGSTLREYIVSESMHALGVPTTRALSIVTTGETIIRNGAEPAAILCRSAKSHIRVGTFQLAAASQDSAHLKALADFTIDRLFPSAPTSGPERYLHLLREAIEGQVNLVSKWMGYGFIHGVMNTDNALISGETIDYGPCAFMDAFHPGKVFSSIDRNGRYAWNRQPEIANWNMLQLARSLLPLFSEFEESSAQMAEQELEQFSPKFVKAFNGVMARKLGLATGALKNPEVLETTFQAMMTSKVDFTLFFRRLTQIAEGHRPEEFISLFETRSAGKGWLEYWKGLIEKSEISTEDRIAMMRSANPIYIARNHRVEEAITAANNGDMEVFKRLLGAVTAPFTERDDLAEFENPPNPDEIVNQTFCGT
ncbi:MAG: protein adenylyltransferase SelO family protein [Hellea sp.]